MTQAKEEEHLHQANVEENRAKKELELLKKMQEEVVYDVSLPPKKSYLALLCKKIPWMARFIPSALGKAGVIASAGEELSGLDSSDTAQEWSRGFHFGSVALSAVDFLRIPLMYLAAFLLKEKIPITLNNNARWLYAGVLLGLSITAMAFPPAAMAIAFVTTCIVLTEATYLFGKAVNDYFRLRKEGKELDATIEQNELEMMQIQKEAHYLEQCLEKATDPKEIELYSQKAEELFTEYNVQKSIVEKLKTQKLSIDQKIKEVNVSKVVDRLVVFYCGAVTLAGLVVSLFFPPAGFALLAIAGVGGVAYKVLGPLVSRFGEWFKEKFMSDSKQDTAENQEVSEQGALSAASAAKYENDSVQKMQHMMGGFHKPPSLTIGEEVEYGEEHVSSNLPQPSDEPLASAEMGAKTVEEVHEEEEEQNLTPR